MRGLVGHRGLSGLGLQGRQRLRLCEEEGMSYGRILFIGATAIALMTFSAPTYSQTLDQQEQLNQRDKVLGAIDKLESLINTMAKEKRLQCMAAIANEPICECLGQKLPMVINFVQYVAIVTQTRDELKYNTLSAEDKQTVDDTRKARDQRLIRRR